MEDVELTEELLIRMLELQERRRFMPETLERMHARTLAGGEWLDVVRDIQREVAMEFGFRSVTGIATAVQRMRTAHTASPELARLSVYARANLAEDGTLQTGNRWPDVPLWTLEGTAIALSACCGDLTVVCAGSWT